MENSVSEKNDGKSKVTKEKQEKSKVEQIVEIRCDQKYKWSKWYTMEML